MSVRFVAPFVTYRVGEGEAPLNQAEDPARRTFFARPFEVVPLPGERAQAIHAGVPCHVPALPLRALAVVPDEVVLPDAVPDPEFLQAVKLERLPAQPDMPGVLQQLAVVVREMMVQCGRVELVALQSDSRFGRGSSSQI